MELSKSKMLEELMKRANLNQEATLSEFAGGELDKVEIVLKDQVWRLNVILPAVVSSSTMVDFQVGVSRHFEHIAKVDFTFIYRDQAYTGHQAYDFWPLVAETLQVDPQMNSFIKTASLHIEEDCLVFLLENQFNRQAFIDNCLDPIKKAYQKYGFENIELSTRIDEKTANDRIKQFQEEQERLEKERLERGQEQLASLGAVVNEETGQVPVKMGRAIKPDAEVTQMVDIYEEERNIIFVGNVFDVEVRDLRSGRKLLIFKITDYSSSFGCRVFSRGEEDEKLFEKIKVGMWLKVRGNIQEDTFERDLVMYINDLVEVHVEKRKDTAPEGEKRVELHLHTNMSALDATNSIGDYIAQAKEWGHQALAITDHAAVQGFPAASNASRGSDLKMLYGIEANVVDDGVPVAYNESDDVLNDATYVVFDVETTGLSAVYNKLIEIGAVKMQNGNIIDQFEAFIDPKEPLTEFISNLTGITDDMLRGQPSDGEVLPKFYDFCRGAILVAHNASFDMDFINKKLESNQMDQLDNPVIDTLELSRTLFPEFKNHRLNTLAKRLDVSLENHHRAIYDAEATAQVFWKLAKKAEEDKGMIIHRDLNREVGQNDSYKQARPHHMSILAKNQKGLKDLFKLVSESNVNYFYRTPRVPMSRLNVYRENFLLGSACSSGKVFGAMMQKGYDQARVEAEAFDYLEVHPKGYYQPLIDTDYVTDEATLEDIIKKICQIGEELDIPVVATGNVHYLDPEDSIYREILINSMKSNNTKHFPEAHFKTTNEMLDDFAFLGKEKAYEIVVTNTQKVAGMIDDVEPLKDELYTPHMENAEEDIRRISYDTAYEKYGPELPEIVVNRLEHELKSIIGNNFSVIYLISRELVKKSNEDGYIVGSRGSVGSSFAATMLGITEVNPLAPHYVCPSCYHNEFFNDGSVGSGFDLKDKDCPECGTSMDKDGHDIPFETFLGFKGDKVPDIDLNFSGEYQAQAHAYTKVLFGEDHVFRAGTISTVADKTAFGYVKAYERDHGHNYRKAEVDRLAKGATGVKRTTGQHPGGIIVIPEEMDVFDFTPIQYPADDQSSEWRTTHFDFHSIDENVLKLDILGHDDPTVLRMLQDLSGIKPEDVPVDDPEVYSLFGGTDALGVTPEQIFSKTGTLGVPEFGTNFVRSMLEQTHPSTFSELLQISGLSHGTDVWLGNAEVLVRDHGLQLSEVIGCRDDIMVYLMHRGLDDNDAFHIMEDVRKGRGLKDEQKVLMREHDVPEWYLESCEKIKYMFPKAHAAAYVLNAIRVAWFKVHHPIWYYCAYMSVRAQDFDLIAMAAGKETTKKEIKKIYALGNEASVKEKDLLVVLELANEMMERGYTFQMVNLEKSDARNFVIDGDSLIPPFRAIPGLGLGAADQIIKARQDQPFLSKEDLSKRGKVGGKVIEYMTQTGVISHLPDENQLSLFDF